MNTELNTSSTCTHHTDSERIACPVCLVTALRAELATERARTTKLAERMLRFATEYYPPNKAGEIDFVRAILEGYAEEMNEGAK
jgi:hypothetical protein